MSSAKIERAPAVQPALKKRERFYRHSLVIRLTHWLNVLCLAILLMSGLQIFNARPDLYWGQKSDFQNPVLSMRSNGSADQPPTKGVTTIFGHDFDTTGVLGLAPNPDGELVERGFPSVATLPGYQDLATGRRWHFFFAWLFVFNGLLYLAYGLAGGHLGRDILPTRGDLRHIGRSILDHMRLRFPSGDEARRYNVLQRLSYLAIILVLVVIALAGLTMSPGLNAVFPESLTVFGGRQSARTIHFLAALILVLFTIVHVAMVILSGAWNNMRSMITGRYDL